MRPARADYLLLLMLGLIWGGSFLLIKLAVATIPPLTVTAARVLVGAAALGGLMRWRRARLPRGWATWGKLGFMGTIGTVAPFALIN
jgi:drug/metabolite transporter (DMT)-like permease